MERKSDIQIKSFSSDNFIQFEDVTVTFSSQYYDTQHELKYLLTPDMSPGWQGWNSGQHTPGWLQIELKQPNFVDQIDLVVNTSPSCDVNYTYEIEIVNGQEQIEKKIIETTQFLSHQQIVPIKIGNKLKSFKITTVSSQSWVAWSRVLFRL